MNRFERHLVATRQPRHPEHFVSRWRVARWDAVYARIEFLQSRLFEERSRGMPTARIRIALYHLVDLLDTPQRKDHP